ncbi:hypothetical protein TraAM80_07644 [Trypanosoma rangeli]|uniref:C3H1-type domain-containing protein n=1 Tax=Trypanosoma rangeli TaxID=5698 RepID=A0A3S5IQI0_TRYRA|nr:uncharacterized protein TraAM80_07644 [Trypanosoma rangeli]RNF00352.1 hypothetical protein TraAM80_07644 [Trypanosoma rangeli]|eukprot:RNF00352.1 hypothetical protein TraAM80_07644 [Trypanosoma rangeli]
MELNYIGAQCVDISGHTTPTNETPCKSTPGNSHVENLGNHALLNGANPPFRPSNSPEDEDTSRMPKSADTLLTSFSSSLCLTEAFQTTTHTLGSSTFSGTSALQNPANAFAVLWETGAKAIFASLGSEVGGSAAEACCDIPLFSNLGGNANAASAPPPSPKYEKPAKNSCSRDEDDDIFSMLNPQPCAAGGNIWKSDATNEGSLERDDESCLEMPQVLPIPSTASSDFLESVTEERFDFMHDTDIEEKVLLVVDPRRSKLRVPLSAISPTRALGVRAQNPSLCLLYQSGRCRQGANCHQVHVDPEVVDRIRRIVDSLPCCCTFHGDYNAHLWNAKANTSRNVVISGVVVPLSRVAYTNGLTRFVTGTTQRPLSRGVLCRLHGKPGGCRYGADCWYLHVCREILENEFAIVIGSHTTNSTTEGNPALSPSVARTGSSVTHDVQATVSFKQQQRSLSTFPFAEISSSAVAVAPFLIQDHKNNGGVGTAFANSSPTVSSAFSCVWVHPTSLPQKSVPTLSSVAAAGGAGLHYESLLQGPFASTMPSQGVSSPSQNLRCETAVLMSNVYSANQAAFAFPMHDGLATQSSMSPTPPYHLVQQTQAVGVTGVQLNSFPSAAYPAMGFTQQQTQQQQQDGQQTYIPQQATNMASSAFIAPPAVYAPPSHLEGFVQLQASAGTGMTFLPAAPYLF